MTNLMSRKLSCALRLLIDQKVFILKYNVNFVIKLTFKNVKSFICIIPIYYAYICVAYFVGRKEEYLLITNTRAQELKKILCKIPEEIDDRKKFLETIKCAIRSIKIQIIYQFTSTQFSFTMLS